MILPKAQAIVTKFSLLMPFQSCTMNHSCPIGLDSICTKLLPQNDMDSCLGLLLFFLFVILMFGKSSQLKVFVIIVCSNRTFAFVTQRTGECVEGNNWTGFVVLQTPVVGTVTIPIMNLVKEPLAAVRVIDVCKPKPVKKKDSYIYLFLVLVCF